ncbi:unnamed protein product [Dovyalis caffra]|uniref:Uncharacterized protein n=1 Tax=Dovyalis caffra TaxID=77055 RepID=A0AAV1RDS4_9ROSI|nr:unnamed protein product [Dovyalis caffra]
MVARAPIPSCLLEPPPPHIHDTTLSLQTSIDSVEQYSNDHERVDHTGRQTSSNMNKTEAAVGNPIILDLRSAPPPQWPLGKNSIKEDVPHKVSLGQLPQVSVDGLSTFDTRHGSQTVNLKEQNGVVHLDVTVHAQASQESDNTTSERLQPPDTRLIKLKETDIAEASHLVFRNRDQPKFLGGQTGEKLNEAVVGTNVMHDMVIEGNRHIMVYNHPGSMHVTIDIPPKALHFAGQKGANPVVLICDPHGVHDTIANISQIMKEQETLSVQLLSVGVKERWKERSNSAVGNHENEGNHIFGINTGKEASYFSILDGLEDESLDRNIQRVSWQGSLSDNDSFDINDSSPLLTRSQSSDRIDVEQEDRVQGKAIKVVSKLRSVL